MLTEVKLATRAAIRHFHLLVDFEISGHCFVLISFL